MTETLVDARAAIHARYVARTPGSRDRFERATRSVPGGSTRTTTFSPPYPPFMERAAGAFEWDVDGNRYLDLLGNYTSLILGHAHPAVVEAVRGQIERGSAFAAPTDLEVELAEELRRRLPALERVRFTNSGTESTMFAIRTARAATGRPLIARFERSYHGTHDGVVSPPLGVPEAIRELTIELPWGDVEAVARAVRGREREVAAVIVEPVQGAGGVRAAGREFLAGLREWTSRHGIMLIFDEIICFRIGPRGAQGVYGVEPDLTTLGKIVGGGYPLAAFGGRAALMDRFDARRPDAMPHGGTFNGNPVAAAAGLATLRVLTPEVYASLEARGARLERGLRDRLGDSGVPFELVRVASLFQLRLGVGEPGDLFLGLLAGGVHLAPRGMGALSTPVTDEDVGDFVAVAADVARELASLDRPASAPAR